jgi:hypothetical protein
MWSSIGYKSRQIEPSVVFILLFGILSSFGIFSLWTIYTPIVTDNKLLVETQCNIIESRIMEQIIDLCNCVNNACECTGQSWYKKINTYSFYIDQAADNDNMLIDIAFSCSSSQPTNDTGQTVTCYYNKCLISQQCELHLNSFSLTRSILSTSEIVITIVWTIALIPMIIGMFFHIIQILKQCCFTCNGSYDKILPLET